MDLYAGTVIVGAAVNGVPATVDVEESLPAIAKVVVEVSITVTAGDSTDVEPARFVPVTVHFNDPPDSGVYVHPVAPEIATSSRDHCTVLIACGARDSR